MRRDTRRSRDIHDAWRGAHSSSPPMCPSCCSIRITIHARDALHGRESLVGLLLAMRTPPSVAPSSCSIAARWAGVSTTFGYRSRGAMLRWLMRHIAATIIMVGVVGCSDGGTVAAGDAGVDVGPEVNEPAPQCTYSTSGPWPPPGTYSSHHICVGPMPRQCTRAQAIWTVRGDRTFDLSVTFDALDPACKYPPIRLTNVPRPSGDSAAAANQTSSMPPRWSFWPNVDYDRTLSKWSASTGQGPLHISNLALESVP